MTRVQLDQFETLLALVDEGSFELASRRLGVTSSAVSQRLKAMESMLGQVVVRRTNPVTVTDAGERLLAYARQFALLSSDAAEAIGSLGQPATMAIAVNADSLATWFLPAIAEAERSVSVAFELRRDDQDHTAELLRRGSVSGAVTSSSAPVQGCDSVRLGVLRYTAVCTPAFAERYLGGEAVADRLPGAPVVLFDRKDALQERFSPAAAESAGARRHYIPSSLEFATAVGLGLGWGVLPEQQCADAIRAGTLVEITGGDPVDVELYWQSWNLRSPTLEAVTAAILRTARATLRQ